MLAKPETVESVRMVDRPIIFSAPMISALLAGRKIQTRRLAWKPWIDGELERYHSVASPDIHLDHRGKRSLWQSVKPGDRLYVRENFRISRAHDKTRMAQIKPQSVTVMFTAGGSVANQDDPTGYRADTWPGADQMPDWAGKLRPAIYLPRWASRLTLVVTATKIEKLQDISEADAIAEGLHVEPRAAVNLIEGGYRPGYFVELPSGRRIGGTVFGPIRVFSSLWKELHGPQSWDANPEVVALTFTVHKQNIDAMNPPNPGAVT